MLFASIKQLTKVNFGPYFKATTKGNVKYLLAGHFDDSYEPVDFENNYITDEQASKHLLTDQDVILAAKGQRVFAWHYKSSYGQCVASSLFYVIRVENADVLPAYLALALNADQTKLKSLGRGATVTAIPKKELSNFMIPIPPLAEQRKHIALADQMSQSIRLTTDLLQHKKILKDTVIKHLLRK